MTLIRILSFFLGLLLLSILEKRSEFFVKRYCHHLALIGLGSVLISVVLPVEPFFHYRWGLLYWLPLPSPFRFVLVLTALDFVVYAQHRLFHQVTWLWRLHAVHHSDNELDVSTGFRFHPIEILISMCVKLLAVFLIGGTLFEFACFQIWLNLGSLFTHANIELPSKVSRWLNAILVTPNAHRIHHIRNTQMQSRNFGFGLILWDRLLRTYLDYEATTEPRVYGLANAPQFKANSFWALLIQPVSTW